MNIEQIVLTTRKLVKRDTINEYCPMIIDDANGHLSILESPPNLDDECRSHKDIAYNWAKSISTSGKYYLLYLDSVHCISIDRINNSKTTDRRFVTINDVSAQQADAPEPPTRPGDP